LRKRLRSEILATVCDCVATVCHNNCQTITAEMTTESNGMKFPVFWNI